MGKEAQKVMYSKGLQTANRGEEWLDSTGDQRVKIKNMG